MKEMIFLIVILSMTIGCASINSKITNWDYQRVESLVHTHYGYDEEEIKCLWIGNFEYDNVLKNILGKVKFTAHYIEIDGQLYIGVFVYADVRKESIAKKTGKERIYHFLGMPKKEKGLLRPEARRIKGTNWYVLCKIPIAELNDKLKATKEDKSKIE